MFMGKLWERRKFSPRVPRTPCTLRPDTNWSSSTDTKTIWWSSIQSHAAALARPFTRRHIAYHLVLLFSTSKAESEIFAEIPVWIWLMGLPHLTLHTNRTYSKFNGRPYSIRSLSKKLADQHKTLAELTYTSWINAKAFYLCVRKTSSHWSVFNVL